MAALGGVLSQFGAIVLLNEAAHTSFPAEALSRSDADGDMMELIRDSPLLILFCGFVKYNIPGTDRVWMRTPARTCWVCPTLPLLPKVTTRVSAISISSRTFSRYLRNSGAHLAAGHTSQVGENEFVRFREPTKTRRFLEADGELLVVEIVGSG